MRRLLLAAIALALCGCSGLSPDAGNASSKVATAERTHEYPSPPARQVAAGSANPVLAIEAFATAYINWTAKTIVSRMRALESISVGQARSAVALAAAQTAQDYELSRGGIANSGTLQAIAPLADQPDTYAVVTRERTTATNTTAYQGLAPAWHVTLATVARVASGGWAVSSWRPEN